MKIIFFLGTVDIFWVMESWVMKKLLGPNVRAKTQFSQKDIRYKRIKIKNKFKINKLFLYISLNSINELLYFNIKIK